MNTNGLDRSAMTRSSTTSSDTLPWLAGLSVCQAQAHHTSRTILSSTTSSTDPHLMLPSAQSAAALGGLYRPPSLTISELTRHPYPPIYTTTGTTLSPYPPTSLYTHAPPPGVSPGITPYGMFYAQHYPQHPPGFSPSSSGDMQQQSFSQLIARISQHAQPHQPRAYHPSHISPHSYPGQSLTSPTGSPGPSSGPHPPIHPSPIQQLPHSALYRDSRTEGRRLAAGSSPLQVEPKQGIHRHSPAQGAHFGLTTKDLPPPTGGPRGDHKDSGLTYSGIKPGADSEYLRQHPGSSSSSSSHRRSLAAHMSSEAVSGVKSEEPSSKRPKVGPPPLHPTLPPPPSSHAVTSSSPSTAPSLPSPPPLHPASYPSHPHYPQHFMRGSIIQLANGELKRVEDLKTDDFVNSADISADLKIDSSTVVRIKNDEERGTAILSFSVGEQRIQVTVEATLEHPFFVFGRGWSSCNPHRTLRRFGLQCSLLSVGDVCISLTQKETTGGTLGPSSSTSGAPGASSSSSGTSMTVTVTCRASSPRDVDPQTGSISGRQVDRKQSEQLSIWGSPADRTTPVRGRFGKSSTTTRASPERAQAHERSAHKEHLPADTVLPQRTPAGSMLTAVTAATHDLTSSHHQTSAPPGAVKRRRWSAPEQSSGEAPPQAGHGAPSTGRLSRQEQKDQPPTGSSSSTATVKMTGSGGNGGNSGSGDTQPQQPQQSQYQAARTPEPHRHT